MDALSTSKTPPFHSSELMARALAWGEAFLLLPLHAFWILYKCAPFVAENTASASVAMIPIAVIVLVGLGTRLRTVRAAFVRLESQLHLTAAVFMALLVFYVVLRDPFNPLVPITWPLCFWSVAIAFVLLSNLALHERMRVPCVKSKLHRGWLPTIAAGFVLWGIVAGLAASMTWPPYFLTASVMFHAAMAVSSRRSRDTNSALAVARGGCWGSASALLEGLALAALILTALMRLLFTCEMLGTAEVKYFQFVDVCASPWFLGGATLALLAIRFRFAFVTHAAVMVVLLASDHAAAWPVPLVLGYALPSLFAASSRQNGFGYALTVAASTGIWGFGLFAFTLAGPVVVFEFGLDVALALEGKARVFTVALYLAWLLLLGANQWWAKKKTQPLECERATVSTLTCGLAYAGIWIAVLSPIAGVAYWAMWPPVLLERAPHVQVGEPTGVCHAGYSRSEKEYSVLDELGVRIMRVDFHWRKVQPDPETWNIGHFDAYMDAAGSHDMNVIAVLSFDNGAVEQSPEGKKRDMYVAPDDVPLFLEYVRRIVTHYKDRVYAWEIWNEADMPRFWKGTAEEFYDLARRTAATVREVHPEGRLLGTAMTSPIGAWVPHQIEGMYKSGALRNVDHPTMHTYVSDPRGYYNEFLRIQNAAAKNGHPGSIWITELGDPDGGVYPWRASSDLLAEHVIKAYTIATSVGIETLVWYCYRDSGLAAQRDAPNNSEAFFGLVAHDGKWKPAAHAYRLFAKNCSNSVIRSDLVEVSGGIGARQLRTALYRRDSGESTLVLWFEPGLRPGGHARVRIDLGALTEPAVAHDITSSYAKPLLDSLVNVTEKPAFITFVAPDGETPVRLDADTSPADGAWLLLLVGFVLYAAWASLTNKSTRRLVP